MNVQRTGLTVIGASAAEALIEDAMAAFDKSNGAIHLAFEIQEFPEDVVRAAKNTLLGQCARYEIARKVALMQAFRAYNHHFPASVNSIKAQSRKTFSKERQIRSRFPMKNVQL